MMRDEGGLVRSLERLEPSAIEHDEEIAARLQYPSEAALEAEKPRFVVVLLQVLPRRVRREIVVGARVMTCV